ncbi:accessory gene regulator B family protein [Metabacillus fastidiosus]|uniref:accessory gene regulator B family protein n=1 Tax=Metabacillus fastidiosus TaxID=1458 RepID=UPI003AF32612
MKILSLKIGRYLNKYSRDIYEESIVCYGVEVMLNSLVKLLTLLILGILIDQLPLLFVILFCFCILRLFSGGYHFKKYFHCYIVSIFSIWTLIFLSIFMNNNLPEKNIIFILIFSALISISILIFVGPQISESRPSSHKRFFFQCSSIIFVILLFLVSMSNVLLNIADKSYSIGINLAIFYQCLLIVLSKIKTYTPSTLLRKSSN